MDDNITVEELVLRLKGVPIKTFLRIPTAPLMSAEIPVGEFCQQAVSLIEQLHKELAQLRAEREGLIDLFGTTLFLIRKQGWCNTSEYNFKLFEEDVFPLLGIESFSGLDKFAKDKLTRTEPTQEG